MQLQRSPAIAAAAAAAPGGALRGAAAAAAAVAAAAALAAIAGIADTHCRKSPWAAAASGWAAGCWGRSRR